MRTENTENFEHGRRLLEWRFRGMSPIPGCSEMEGDDEKWREMRQDYMLGKTRGSGSVGRFLVNLLAVGIVTLRLPNLDTSNFLWGWRRDARMASILSTQSLLTPDQSDLILITHLIRSAITCFWFTHRSRSLIHDLIVKWGGKIRMPDFIEVPPKMSCWDS